MRTESDRIKKYVQFFLIFLRIDIVFGIIWMFSDGNWEAFFINILALMLTFAPHFARIRYGIRLPLDFVVVIVLFIYASMFLGSTIDAYDKFFWWDAILHFASGIVLSFVALLILYAMYADGSLKARPFVIALFTFSFGLALGGVWEIFEFAVDSLFGTNMQRSGLSDTMWDLIVDAIGSFIVAIVAYDIIKNKRKDGIILDAIERYLERNTKHAKE